VFRLDRIVALSELDGECDSVQNAEELITANGEESTKIQYTIKIRKLTRDVIERFNLGQMLTDNAKSHEITVELSSFSVEWIQRAVLATGADVELLAPPDLRKEVANRARLLLDRYT